MKAWRAHAVGEPSDVLHLDDIDPPACGPGDVLVEVEAVGLSFPDVLQCRGGYQVKRPLPFTVGTEVCGTVVDVGGGVTGMTVGQRVAATVDGGLAELVALPASGALTVPATVPAVKAAAMLGNYTTTWHALHDRALLRSSETMLVHAGAGGVGSSAIELGRATGARIVATAGGPEKTEICRRIGADVVIDYESEDLVEHVRAATDGIGVDVVYDPVGGDVFDRARRTVAWGGRYLVIGFASGRIPDAPLNHVLLKGYSIVGVHWGAAIERDPSAMERAFASVIELYESGCIDPLVFREPVPLAGAAEALTLLATRRTWGKVVVDPKR